MQYVNKLTLTTRRTGILWVWEFVLHPFCWISEDSDPKEMRLSAARLAVPAGSLFRWSLLQGDTNQLMELDERL